MVEEFRLLFFIFLPLHRLGFVGVQKDEEAKAEGYNEEGIPEVEVSIFLAKFDFAVDNNFKVPEQKSEEGGEDPEKHRGIDVAPGNKTEHGIENQIMYFPSLGQVM